MSATVVETSNQQASDFFKVCSDQIKLAVKDDKVTTVMNQVLRMLLCQNNYKSGRAIWDYKNGLFVELQYSHTTVRTVATETGCQKLHIPKVVKFEIKNGTTTCVFPDETCAPYEEVLDSILFKMNQIWFQFSVNEKKVTLSCHNLYGLFYPYFGSETPSSVEHYTTNFIQSIATYQ